MSQSVIWWWVVMDIGNFGTEFPQMSLIKVYSPTIIRNHQFNCLFIRSLLLYQQQHFKWQIIIGAEIIIEYFAVNLSL